MYNGLRRNKTRSWSYQSNDYVHRVYQGRKFVFNAEEAIDDLLWWYWVYRRNPSATPWYQSCSRELVEVCNLPLRREGSHWVPTGGVRSAIVPLIDYLHNGQFWNSFSTDGTGVLAYEDRGEPHLE